MPGVEAMQGQAGRRRAERQTSSCTECRRRKQKVTVIFHFFGFGPVPCQIVSVPDRVTRFPWLDVVVHVNNPGRDSLMSALVRQLYRYDSACSCILELTSLASVFTRPTVHKLSSPVSPAYLRIQGQVLKKVSYTWLFSGF